MRFKPKTMKRINKNDNDTVHSYTIKVIKKKLPTTAQMVDNTLIKLNKHKGVSLQFLYNHIIREYIIKKTARRYDLIKKRLLELKQMGYITNASGTGLVGRLKLLNKNEFVKKFIFEKKSKKPQRENKPNLNLNKILNINSNVLVKTPSRRHLHTSITDSNVDNFNSWVLSNDINNSTPLMEVVKAPPAPVATKKARKRNYDVDLFETPRSSKGKRRRNKRKS